jgi:septal ring factor EnvC (AmiA/AmiB activator)
MNGSDGYILTVIGSIISFMAAQKWIFPLIVKFWDWLVDKKKDFDDKNVDASNELLKYKQSAIETQEKQFQVLLNQITALEVELQKYADDLQKMRNTILRLNSRLYDKSLLIAELQKKSCCVEGCKHRELCKNNLDKINELDEVE